METKKPSHGASGKAGGGGLLDPAAFERLKSIGGDDPAFLADLISTFLEESPALVANLRKAAEAGDLDALRRSAHSLKSNSAEFGATALSGLARELEEMARNRTLEGAMERVASAEKEYRSVRAALEEMRGKA
jgi:HPt (histidine-containing phosphotransfer) domain-containing protein